MMGGHRLTLIGAGGLAHSLAHAFVQRSPHQVVQVLSRTGTTAELLVRQLPAARAGDMRQAVHTGVQAVLLCVPDGQIVTLAHALAPQLQAMPGPPLLLHCAGSVPLSALAAAYPGPVGVLYPLQTFSRGRAVDWDPIPLFLEANAGGADLLRQLATGLRPAACHWIDSEQRAQLHLGAVFAANFVNALIAQAARIAAPIGLGDQPHRLYLPLVEEVVAKLHSLSPKQAQTGPASRGDAHTLAQHDARLRLLAPELAELYRLMSQLIQDSSMET